MKTKIRTYFRITAVAFTCAIILFSQMGSTYVYLFQRSGIKKEVRKKLEHGIHMDRLHTFSIAEIEKEKSFRWEDAIEFFYKGNLYDIVERNGDIAICYLDIKEKALMEAFHKANSEAASSKHKNKTVVEIKLFSLVVPYLNLCDNSITASHYFSKLNIDLLLGHLQKISSPPEIG